jgi:hypothetical protein
LSRVAPQGFANPDMLLQRRQLSYHSSTFQRFPSLDCIALSCNELRVGLQSRSQRASFDENTGKRVANGRNVTTEPAHKVGSLMRNRALQHLTMDLRSCQSARPKSSASGERLRIGKAGNLLRCVQWRMRSEDPSNQSRKAKIGEIGICPDSTCGRYHRTATLTQLQDFFEAVAPFESLAFTPAFNLAPLTGHVIQAGDSNRRELVIAQWRLIGHRPEPDPKKSTINARERFACSSCVLTRGRRYRVCRTLSFLRGEVSGAACTLGITWSRNPHI